MASTTTIAAKRMSPTEHLLWHSGAKSNGELIIEGPDVEVRVYLEQGRLAWSSSTRSKRAFTSFLTERLGVEKTVIESAIAACRRENRPFGEYLVEHGVVSGQQMEDALRQQIAGALSDLKSLETSGRSFFVPRSEIHRQHRATFSVWDVLDLSGDSAPEHSEGVKSDIEALDLRFPDLDALPGYLGSVVSDRSKGMVLSVHGQVSLSLARMANEFFRVFRAESEALRILDLESEFEEMVSTLSQQFHVTRIVGCSRSLLMHAAFDRGTELALVRVKLRAWADRVATSAAN
ncbi:MAG: DUF4388 domain-containing protein [Myxococcota bacterium]